MIKVPFLDLKAQYAGIREDIEAALKGVLDDASFVLGPPVSRFEEAFAAYCNRKHCIAVNSGTSALHLALLASGVGPGDEVVTTPHTWISTSWAISYCGARPIFADVDPSTGNLDPGAAAAAVTGRTKVLLPVNLYGNPAPNARFEELAARASVILVEDAAQSHGAVLGGRKSGSFGRLSCFSFYPGKNLGAVGEGGAVVTDDDAAAERIRRLRDHAQAGRHNHVEIGFNYRMEAIQGAVLGVKLRHLDGWNEQRRVAAARYGRLLSDVPGLVLPEPIPGATPVWHLYVVRVRERERVAAVLAERGIGTGVHYPRPVHLQPAYATLGHRPGSFPRAEAFAAECLSLPMFPEISEEQQAAVADALRAALS